MKYKKITIWHKTGNQYRRFLFDKAYVVNSASVKGAAAGELFENDLLVRVFTPREFGIAPGDKLYLGRASSLSPIGGAYIISEVTPFFCASTNLRHYKLKCK